MLKHEVSKTPADTIASGVTPYVVAVDGNAVVERRGNRQATYLVYRSESYHSRAGLARVQANLPSAYLHKRGAS